MYIFNICVCSKLRLLCGLSPVGGVVANLMFDIRRRRVVDEQIRC